MSTDAICTCSHGLGVLRHADDCPVAIERRQPVRLAALSAPSEPVRPEPRVWAAPTIPDDVSAFRDAEGRVWRRDPKKPGWRRDTGAWTEKDPLDLLRYHPRLSPLTEVVEP